MKRLIALMVVSLAVVATACGSKGAVAVRPIDAESPNTPKPTSPAPSNGKPSPKLSPTGSTSSNKPPAGTLTVQVWFTQGEKLYSTTRSQEATLAVGRAALNALLDGPSSAERKAGIGTTIPSGTDLLGLTIADGVATVDLSASFDDGGGSASERMRLAQVVYTITQFPTVQGVNFRMEGKPVTTFSGEGIVLDHPQTRGDYEDLLPAIVVDSPRVGASVSSPVTITGTADVFEATVSFQILDENGHVLTQGATTATCGTGCRGDYTIVAAFHVSHDQQGTIEVFESSARDGSHVNVVRIPVTLKA